MAQNRIWEDVKELPHWVWFGAAGVGALLFIMSRSSSASGSTPVATVATPSGIVQGSSTPIGGGGGSVIDPYSYQQMYYNQDYQNGLISELLAALQQQQGISGGQPPAQPAPPPNGFNIDTWTLPQGTFTGAIPQNPTANPQIYGLIGGNWVPINNSILSQMLSKSSGPPQSSNYTGPGTYNGVTIPGLP